MNASSTVITVMLCISGFAEDRDKETKIKQEVSLFQGAWKVVSVQAPEGDDTLEQLQKEGYKITFKGQQLTIRTNHGDIAGRYSLDPTRKPKTIDIVIASVEKGEKWKDIKYLGIYKLDGDTLTICHNPDYFPRPTDFRPPDKTRPNRGLTGILSFKREKQ